VLYNTSLKTTYNNSTYLDINNTAQLYKSKTTALQQAVNCMREPKSKPQEADLEGCIDESDYHVALGVLVREGVPAYHI